MADSVDRDRREDRDRPSPCSIERQVYRYQVLVWLGPRPTSDEYGCSRFPCLATGYVETGTLSSIIPSQVPRRTPLHSRQSSGLEDERLRRSTTFDRDITDFVKHGLSNVSESQTRKSQPNRNSAVSLENAPHEGSTLRFQFGSCSMRRCFHRLRVIMVDKLWDRIVIRLDGSENESNTPV